MLQVDETPEKCFFSQWRWLTQIPVACSSLFRNSDLMSLISIYHTDDQEWLHVRRLLPSGQLLLMWIRIQRQCGHTQQGHICLSKELVSWPFNFLGINMKILPDGLIEDFYYESGHQTRVLSRQQASYMCICLDWCCVAYLVKASLEILCVFTSEPTSL